MNQRAGSCFPGRLCLSPLRMSHLLSSCSRGLPSILLRGGLLRPGQDSPCFCRISALGVASPAPASSRPGPGNDSVGPASHRLEPGLLPVQIQWAAYQRPLRTEEPADLTQNTGSEEVGLKQSDGSQPAPFGLSSPAFLWFCDILSQEVTKDSPLSREHRTQCPSPILPVLV